jgi:hypothetical protein
MQGPSTKSMLRMTLLFGVAVAVTITAFGGGPRQAETIVLSAAVWALAAFVLAYVLAIYRWNPWTRAWILAGFCTVFGVAFTAAMAILGSPDVWYGVAVMVGVVFAWIRTIGLYRTRESEPPT